MVNAIRSPGATVKSAYVVSALPYVSQAVSNHTESGPATATVRPSCLCTQGTTRPYEKRIRSAERIGTRPVTPSTIRISCGAPSRGGMKSVTRTVPRGVSHSDSRISESPRYERRAAVGGSASAAWAGPSRQNPCSSVPSSPAKMAWESKRGRHSQSTVPSRQTSAAVCMSPMSA